ncbi:MAG TPA: chloramphenicol acetyltransferase [Chroococcales cyanobacterium]
MQPPRQEIDIANWKRAPHFEFFSQFHDPSYGITLRVDCTAAYQHAKSGGNSFFLSCLYWSLCAAQKVDAFRLRIDDGNVYLYERADGGSAIDRPNGTFGFGQFPFNSDMQLFLKAAQAEVERVRSTTDLLRAEANNVIRYSSLPWIDFTSLTHAQRFAQADSSPRITFGKMTESDGRRSMPVAIHVHHGLVDGRDVGQFTELFQEILAAPDKVR